MHATIINNWAQLISVCPNPQPLKIQITGFDWCQTLHTFIITVGLWQLLTPPVDVNRHYKCDEPFDILMNSRPPHPARDVQQHWGNTVCAEYVQWSPCKAATSPPGGRQACQVSVCNPKKLIRLKLSCWMLTKIGALIFILHLLASWFSFNYNNIMQSVIVKGK